MEKVLAFLESIGNYLLLIRVSDVLDIVIIAFLAIVANIVADIIYALLDPRIRINA